MAIRTMSIRKGLTLPKRLSARFVSLSDEKILLATRTHWFDVGFPVGGLGLFGLAGTALVLFLLLNGFLAPPIFLLVIITVWGIMAVLIGFVVLSWYFHFYVVTNRKILEVRHLPFIYYDVNDVLLDQVRCTELDIKQNGIISSFFNAGDIVLTFDRPTHEEEFILSNIADPETVGIFLSDVLETLRTEKQETGKEETIWYLSQGKKKYRFTEEIFPKYSAHAP